MGYRKIQADSAFDGREWMDGPVTLVCDAEGVCKALLSPEDAGQPTSTHEGVLCPGFVNTHCHLELSHLRGAIPAGTGLVDFLISVMGNRGGDGLGAARQADRAMHASGIVAIGDIANTDLTRPVKRESPLYYHTFVEVAGFVPAGAESRWSEAMTPYRTFGQSLAPHAPYSVSRELFARININPGSAILTIHNQESEEENRFFRDGTGEFRRLYEALGIDIGFYRASGESSLRTYLPWLTTAQNLLLVHNVATSAEDIAFAETLATTRNQALYWCLCPKANKYIQGVAPPVQVLLDAGCTITLGTDSLASNDSLDLLSEMRELQETFPFLTFETMLGWATANGAEALGIDRRFGSLAPGKQPGILLLEGIEGRTLTPESRVTRLL